MPRQTLFISYCWKDGTEYAEELEAQLSDRFIVKRDKSLLKTNDDVYAFMKGIVDCDNVVIVLTAEYVKSLNCMLEMSYLFAQEDWETKAMVLVIDESLYSTERKIEVLNYWYLWRKRYSGQVGANSMGAEILGEERKYVVQICEQLEGFLKGVSRRKNPSQIAIVNEIIKKSNSEDRKISKDTISKAEQFVFDVLEKNGDMTIDELSEMIKHSNATTHRYVEDLVSSKQVERVSDKKLTKYKAVKK